MKLFRTSDLYVVTEFQISLHYQLLYLVCCWKNI